MNSRVGKAQLDHEATQQDCRVACAAPPKSLNVCSTEFYAPAPADNARVPASIAFPDSVVRTNSPPKMWGMVALILIAVAAGAFSFGVGLKVHPLVASGLACVVFCILLNYLKRRI
jgi:hypothetical protein